MPTEISPSELDGVLRNTIAAYANNDKFCSAILLCLFNTGLRINEVLQVWRWSIAGAGLYNVVLEKGDSVRILSSDLIPPLLKEFYNVGIESNIYTYSSILWRINKATPIITVNGDKRRSSAHLFRYNFIKRLYADGLTTKQIKDIICHKSQSSTDQYVFDRMYLH